MVGFSHQLTSVGFPEIERVCLQYKIDPKVIYSGNLVGCSLPPDCFSLSSLGKANNIRRKGCLGGQNPPKHHQPSNQVHKSYRIYIYLRKILVDGKDLYLT
jgi:hypothetical protein